MRSFVPMLLMRTTWVVVLLLALALAGCRKPSEELGLEVLPEGDALGSMVMDTTRIVAWSRTPEPGKTSALSRNVLGTYLDPDFGLVSAGLAFQVRLSTNNVGPFDATNVCDSLVLSLAYEPIHYGYGNRDPQAFRVYRIQEKLSLDSVYQSDDVPACLPIDLVTGARRTWPIEPFQGPVVGGDTLAPQLRLPLSKALGEELLSRWGSADLAENNAFLDYFRGLLVVPDGEPTLPFQQAALYISLLSPDSRLTLYYHNASDTARYDFIINSTCVRYTISRFDHARALEPGLPAALADTALGQQRVYLQALGGLRGEIRFPGIEQYRSKGFGALAKAELILPVAGSYYPLYPPPSQIFVFRKDAQGNDATIPDQLPSANLVGGIFDPQARAYKLVITQWLQGVIDGTYPNTGLGIIPGSNGVAVNRAILAGPEASGERMRLKLTFTTY